jgi:MFS family permease
VAADGVLRLAALSEPDFRMLYLARALSVLGDAMVPVALSFAVLEAGGGASGLGYVFGSRTLALVLTLLLGGALADRRPRRQILISSDLIRLFAHAAIAVLVITDVVDVWHMVALSFVFGIGWALFLPTSTGFVPETVSRDHLQQANALLAATFSTAQVIGPALGGLLVVATGAGWALAVDAATFAASAVLVARIRAGRERPRRRASIWADVREGWREFTSRTWLWVDGVFSGLAAFLVLPAFFAIGPLVAQRRLGGAGAWATIVTAFGVGSLAAAFVLARVRFRRPLLAGVPPLMLLAAPLLLLVVSSDARVIAVGAAAGGFGLTLFNTLFETAVQQNVPADALSRVASIDWMLSQSLLPLGFALVGPVVTAVGVTPPLVAAAGWLLVATSLVITIPSVRRLESSPGPS